MSAPITIEQVRQAKPKKIYYSVNTVWWTHDPKDVHLAPPQGPHGFRLPLDAFGSPLFESEAVDEFLNEDAIKAHPAYGAAPLENFMACHARNIEGLRKVPGFSPRMKYAEVAKLLDAWRLKS